jgi:hypothetical protein
MLTKRDVILAKIESVYNTDPTPVAATDAVFVENPAWSHAGARMIERKGTRPSLGQLKQLFGGTLLQVTFDMELKGAGSAYSSSVRPECDVLLRACGFAATVDTTGGSESVTYVPASSSHESCTIYYYQDGMLFKLTGCRGTVSFNFETGNKGMASFTITGHTATPTDSALPTPTYDSTTPPPFVNAGFSIDAFSAVINALAFDMGNKVATPADANATDGYGEIQIVDRDVNGSFDPEAELVATEDFIGNWRSGAAMVLDTGSIGSTQYNKYDLNMPAVSYRDVGPGDRDGVRTYELKYGAHESSGDDEITIVFD